MFLLLLKKNPVVNILVTIVTEVLMQLLTSMMEVSQSRCSNANLDKEHINLRKTKATRFFKNGTKYTCDSCKTRWVAQYVLIEGCSASSEKIDTDIIFTGTRKVHTDIWYIKWELEQYLQMHNYALEMNIYCSGPLPKCITATMKPIEVIINIQVAPSRIYRVVSKEVEGMLNDLIKNSQPIGEVK